MGRTLAVTASSLLFAEIVLALVSFFVVLKMTWMDAEESEFQLLSQTTPSAALTYGIWGLGVFGMLVAMAAITLFNFRERWFWRCMVTAAVLWLVFPPIPTLLGIIALILLFRYREAFPLHTRAGTT